jgi:hypothetical protein
MNNAGQVALILSFERQCRSGRWVNKGPGSLRKENYVKPEDASRVHGNKQGNSKP